jgi:hypothetical protein
LSTENFWLLFHCIIDNAILILNTEINQKW